MSALLAAACLFLSACSSLSVTADVEQLMRPPTLSAEQEQVRDALEAAGIDFTYKVRNRTSPTMTASGSRERFGNANIRHDAHMEYRLFVHRDQLDWAQTFLKQ